MEKRCLKCKKIIIEDYLKWIEDNPEIKYLQCCYCDYVEKIK